MTNYKLNDEKMFADVTDDIAIIINSETGIYYGMNSLGTLVYENLNNGVSAESILAKLKSFSNAPESLEQDFNNFIRKMCELGILTEASNSEMKVLMSEKDAVESNFLFEINEYNDAQELLLADPIHEVKEDTGWTPEKDSIGYTKEETRKREEKMEIC